MKVILKLLIIELFGASASAMQADDEGISPWRFFANGEVLDLHSFACEGDGALLDHFEVLVALVLQFEPLLVDVGVAEHWY